MGLRPTLTLSQQEALVDTAIPILPSPTSPKFSSPTTDLTSDADRIKKEWESKNKSPVHDKEGVQLSRMTNFKFGGSSIPLETDASVTDSDSGRSPATSLDLPSISSSAAHESVSSPNQTSIFELEKRDEDFPSSCEQLSLTNGLSPSLARKIDPLMLPLPPSPSHSRFQGDTLSVISSISKASRHEKAGLNGGLNTNEAPALRPLLPSPSPSTTGEAHSTLNTPRALTPVPPPPMISLSLPDPSPNSPKVPQSGCASNLYVDAATIAPLTTPTSSLSLGSCIPTSSTTLVTSPPEPSFGIHPSQDIPVISEVPNDDLIGLIAKIESNRDNLDVVYEEPEMLSASGPRVTSRSGSLRKSPSAPKEIARSRSASRTREPLKGDDVVVLKGGETDGGILAAQEAEAEVKRLPDPPSWEGASEQPESSASASVPTTPKLPPKRGMTEGGGEKKKKGVFNRFKRSNTTSAVADATEHPLPLRRKPSVATLSSVRRRVVSTFSTGRTSLDPTDGSDKWSQYPSSPTSATSSVFRSIRSVGNRCVSPAGAQSTRCMSPIRQPVAPTMHNQSSIASQTNAIEDEETRRMAELAFLS